MYFEEAFSMNTVYINKKILFTKLIQQEQVVQTDAYKNIIK